MVRRRRVWLAALVLAGIVAVPTLAARKPVKYHCVGTERVIFDNTNGGLVANGGARPTFSTGTKAYCVTYIQTYHWNNGKGPGRATGFVGLTGKANALHGAGSAGSWKVTASNGQNNAPNVNWRANLPHTPPVIIKGTYTCNDSAPGTWSQDPQSGGFGFCTVGGTPAVRTK